MFGNGWTDLKNPVTNPAIVGMECSKEHLNPPDSPPDQLQTAEYPSLSNFTKDSWWDFGAKANLQAQASANLMAALELTAKDKTTVSLGGMRQKSADLKSLIIQDGTAVVNDAIYVDSFNIDIHKESDLKGDLDVDLVKQKIKDASGKLKLNIDFKKGDNTAMVGTNLALAVRTGVWRSLDKAPQKYTNLEFSSLRNSKFGDWAIWLTPLSATEKDKTLYSACFNINIKNDKLDKKPQKLIFCPQKEQIANDTPIDRYNPTPEYITPGLIGRFADVSGLDPIIGTRLKVNFDNLIFSYNSDPDGSLILKSATGFFSTEVQRFTLETVRCP